MGHASVFHIEDVETDLFCFGIADCAIVLDGRCRHVENHLFARRSIFLQHPIFLLRGEQVGIGKQGDFGDLGRGIGRIIAEDVGVPLLNQNTPIEREKAIFTPETHVLLHVDLQGASLA